MCQISETTNSLSFGTSLLLKCLGLKAGLLQSLRWQKERMKDKRLEWQMEYIYGGIHALRSVDGSSRVALLCNIMNMQTSLVWTHNYAWIMNSSWRSQKSQKKECEQQFCMFVLAYTLLLISFFSLGYIFRKLVSFYAVFSATFFDLKILIFTGVAVTFPPTLLYLL
jgi:hypothetical protein